MTTTSIPTIQDSLIHSFLGPRKRAVNLVQPKILLVWTDISFLLSYVGKKEGHNIVIVAVIGFSSCVYLCAKNRKKEKRTEQR